MLPPYPSTITGYLIPVPKLDPPAGSAYVSAIRVYSRLALFFLSGFGRYFAPLKPAPERAAQSVVRSGARGKITC